MGYKENDWEHNNGPYVIAALVAVGVIMLTGVVTIGYGAFLAVKYLINLF